MNDSDNLREQLWDLVYGLLEAEESQALIARIKSDPQAARLYSEVRLQADLVGYAAQVEDSSVVLHAEAAARGGASGPAKKSGPPVTITPAAKGGPAAAHGRPRTGTWLVGFLAAALGLLIAVGLLWPRVDEHQLARSFVVTDIETARAMPAGLSNEVSFHFTGIDGVGRPAVADLAVVDAAGNEIYRSEVVSNGIGQAQVELPGAVLQPGARLKLYAAAKAAAAPEAPAKTAASNDLAAEEVAKAEAATNETTADDYTMAARDLAKARSRQSAAEAILEADLPVQPEPTVAYLLFDRPTIEPGAPIQFSLWNLSAVTGQPVATPISGIAVENADGVVVAEPLWQADADLPVVTGQLQLPAEAGMQDLALSLQPLGGQEVNVPLQEHNYFYEQAGQRKSDAVKLALDDPVRRQKFQEQADWAKPGGKLAEQAEKDSASGIPAERLPAVASGTRISGEEKQRAGRAQEVEGLARLDKPTGRPDADDLDRVAQAEQGLAEQTLAVPVPAQLANRRALGIVRYRGSAVAKETVEPAPQEVAKGLADERGEPAVARFALPAEVEGAVDVQWFDATSDPPQPVAAEVVARQSQRKLHVDLVDQPPAFRPGERVQLTLKVTDESGQPAADALLVARLWSDEAIAASGREPAQLEAMFESSPEVLLLGQVDYKALASIVPGDRQKDTLAADARGESLAYRYHDGTAPALKKEVESRHGTELDADGAELAGISGRGADGYGVVPFTNSFADRPAVQSAERVASELATFERQTLATNRPHMEAELQALKLQAEERRRATVQSIGQMLLVGGCAGLLLVGLLLLFRLPAKRRVILPALGIALASLLIGFTWTGWLSTEKWHELASTTAPAGRHVAIAPAAPAPAAAAPRAAAPMNEAETLREIPRGGGMGGAFGSAAESAPSAPSGTTLESFAGGAAPADSPTPAGASASAESSALADAAPPAEATSPEGSPADSVRPGAAPEEAAAGALAAPAEPLGAKEGRASPERAMADARPPSNSAELKSGDKAMLEKRARMSRVADAETNTRSATDRQAKAAGSAVVAGDKPAVVEDRASSGRGPKSGESLPRSAATPQLAASNAPSPPAPAAPTPAPAPAPAAPSPAPAPTAEPASPDAASPPAPVLSRSDPAAMKAKSDERSSTSGLARGGAAGAGVRDMVRQEARSAPGERESNGQLFASGVPASLYFNPHLTTDDRGLATIEFTMPAVESEYRLLIDAVGSGRVGSSQMPILGRKE